VEGGLRQWVGGVHRLNALVLSGAGGPSGRSRINGLYGSPCCIRSFGRVNSAYSEVGTVGSGESCR
jgi:hypothetical protein